MPADDRARRATLDWSDVAEACEQEELSKRDAAFLATLWDAAATEREHLNLRWRDVRWGDDQVLVHLDGKRPKGAWIQLTRSVPYFRAWLNELYAYTPGAEIPADWPVWRHPGRARSPPRGITTRICRRADLDVGSPHDLRRSRIIQWMETGDEEG